MTTPNFTCSVEQTTAEIHDNAIDTNLQFNLEQESIIDWDISPCAEKTFATISKPIATIEQAVGENLDNAEDASATEFHVHVKEIDRNDGTHPDISMFFTDNGYGMDVFDILKLFKLGVSHSKKGFKTNGYLGVGALAAAHACCNKVWAISQKKGSEITAAYLDFTKLSGDNDYKSKDVTGYYIGHQEVSANVPKELLKEFTNREEGTTILWERVHPEWGTTANNIKNKLLRPRSKTNRHSLSFINREKLADKDIVVYINHSMLEPTGHCYSFNEEGRAKFHKYFLSDGNGGKRNYSLTGPKNKKWKMSATFSVELPFASTPNLGEVHILRNKKEISCNKIPLGSHHDTDWSVGRFHVDLSIEPEFLDTYFPIASEKTVSSIKRIRGFQNYKLNEKIEKLLRGDIELCKKYNKNNFATSEQILQKKAETYKDFPEVIFQMRYGNHLKNTLKNKGYSDEQIGKSIMPEYSPEGSLQRFDFLVGGEIEEIKLSADRNSLLQCMGYMGLIGKRKCKLISILPPSKNFISDKKQLEEFYNVKFEYVCAENDYLLKLALIGQQTTKEEKALISELKKQKK